MNPSSKSSLPALAGRAGRRPAVSLASLVSPLLLLSLLAGCASLPSALEIERGRDLVAPSIPRSGSVATPVRGRLDSAALGGAAAPLRDGRARFRELFCGRFREVATGAGGTCDEWLWRLRDEPPASALEAPPPVAPAPPQSPLRLVVVTGAFSDCFGRDALPFGDAIAALRARGYRIDTIQVSGRSSASHNARQLVAALGSLDAASGERLALLGYSKGAIDILQALADSPAMASRVAAVISLAGPIGGTPLAESGRWWYDHLAARAAAKRCDPGDGGVVDSLLPAARRAALAAQPVPAPVRLYSLAALPESARVASVLRGSARLLARSDRWNDGQVTVSDALLPGSTVLGLLNADHWGVALRIERTLPRLAARRDPRPFPQEALLEAALLYVSEDAATQTPVAGETPRG